MIPFSILDLCPILEGSSPTQSFANAAELAQLAENLNYKRFWVSEHHNIPGIASSATALIISHIADTTNHIRVGSGGIMLPNHAPLIVAEQFGTLAYLYPDRIDLGIGRAPGTDQVTSVALRRNLETEVENFPEDVIELRHYLQPKQLYQKVLAIPGVGTKVPIWLLGSSLFSANLASSLSTPFVFASHFAPDYLIPALSLYREKFQASKDMEKPYTMAAIVAIVADTDEEAHYLFSSMLQQTISTYQSNPILLPPPCKNIRAIYNDEQLTTVLHSFKEAIIGSPTTVATKLKSFIARTQVNELMITARIFDRNARLHSFTKLAEIRDLL